MNLPVLNKATSVGFEVLTTVVMNAAIAWDTAPCSPYMKPTFRRNVSPSARWFLARMIFDYDDGGDTFFRNVGSHTDYKALYSKLRALLLSFTVLITNCSLSFGALKYRLVFSLGSKCKQPKDCFHHLSATTISISVAEAVSKVRGREVRYHTGGSLLRRRVRFPGRS
jgi:hypothetical protein